MNRHSMTLKRLKTTVKIFSHLHTGYTADLLVYEKNNLSLEIKDSNNKTIACKNDMTVREARHFLDGIEDTLRYFTK